MDPHELRRSLEQDIAETHKLISVTTRPVVRECLLQLFTTLEQTKARLFYGLSLHSTTSGQTYSSGYAAGFPLAVNHPLQNAQSLDHERSTSQQGQSVAPQEGVLSPYDPVWSAPAHSLFHSSSAGPAWPGPQQQLPMLPGPGPPASSQFSIQEVPVGEDQHNLLLSSALPVLPALRYGMNLQLMAAQPAVQPEAEYRILTTCSWEQSPYTVKIYVPLHGVKTDSLRAVFEPNCLEVKALNLQGKNYRFSIKRTFMPLNPDGCSVVASKTKKNILITIAKASSRTQEEKHWHDLHQAFSD